jgi:Sec-independent protein translocase protein TatA
VLPKERHVVLGPKKIPKRLAIVFVVLGPKRPSVVDDIGVVQKILQARQPSKALGDGDVF